MRGEEEENSQPPSAMMQIFPVLTCTCVVATMHGGCGPTRVDEQHKRCRHTAELMYYFLQRQFRRGHDEDRVAVS